MNFLNPIFLYILPLALFPVVLHMIFNIVRKQKVFPNILILKNIKEQERGLKKFSDIILMLLRVLIIVIIVLLLSRPFLSSSKMPSLIVFDVSASMKPFKEKIIEISNNYLNVKKVYISDRIYENMPSSFNSYLKPEVLEKFNGDTILVISDFQKSNYLSLGSYGKFKIGEVSKNRAILQAVQKSETLIIKLKGEGTIEIYEDRNLLYIVNTKDSILKIANLKVKQGFLKLVFLPLDSLEYDNYYYTFFEPHRILKVRIFSDNVNYKLINTFLKTIFNPIEGDEIFIIAEKNFPISSILGQNSKAIVFYDNLNIPYEIKTNYIFNGVIIDSIMLFSNSPVYKKDNIFLIGMKPNVIFLNPKLTIWFENFLNEIVGKYKVIYASVGDRIDLEKETIIRTPSNIKLISSSINITELGFYTSDEEKIVIVSNVNRVESVNQYLSVKSQNLPRINEISSIVSFILLTIFLVETLYAQGSKLRK
ncbi:MAG: BatA domain-containing protein [candidate division WOR-3 bacterium]|nr:BatA domain-containing protein [candidate division WOR-3 bacterium]MDW8150058.1 BatA domain-containing protein [candidate division WOR-3 bacterium]